MDGGSLCCLQLLLDLLYFLVVDRAVSAIAARPEMCVLSFESYLDLTFGHRWMTHLARLPFSPSRLDYLKLEAAGGNREEDDEAQLVTPCCRVVRALYNPSTSGSTLETGFQREWVVVCIV